MASSVTESDTSTRNTVLMRALSVVRERRARASTKVAISAARKSTPSHFCSGGRSARERVATHPSRGIRLRATSARDARNS